MDTETTGIYAKRKKKKEKRKKKSPLREWTGNECEIRKAALREGLAAALKWHPAYLLYIFPCDRSLSTGQKRSSPQPHR
jgi:hypothetical protein